MKQRKKIALVNVFFPPQALGGATRVVADNFDVLITDHAKQFETVVFTSDADMQVAPHQLDSYIYKGARVYRTSVIFREHMDWHPKDPEMKKLFLRFLELENPDIVHFHCVQRLTASIVEACLEKNIPYFITLHDAWWISDFQFLVDSKGKVYPEGHTDVYEELELPNGVTQNESRQRKLYFRNLLSNAQLLFSVSESFKKIYEKNGINNIRVTKNGISRLASWESKNTSHTPKLVCGHIGGMSAHKGYDILKKAVELTQPENLEFLVVDHSQDEGYESKSTWNGVPVTYIGRVRQEKIMELYRRIDVLFAPSIWPESFGLVTREAAACGCWVVASNLGGIGEDVVNNETGFVIDPKIEALAATIVNIDYDFIRFKSPPEVSSTRFSDKQVKELVETYNA